MRFWIVALCAWLWGASCAWASSITIVAGQVGVKEFGPAVVAGPGAVAASVEATGQTDPMGGQGEKCNDETKIGPNNDEPIIDQKLTERIGSALKNTVGVKLQGKTDLEVGRSIFYKTDKSNDKVKAAKDDGGELNLFARAALGNQPTASSSHTVMVKDDKVTADGAASANAPGRGQFAAAILNDPLVFQANSSTLDLSVSIILGGELSLQATEPGDLAEAVFQIGQDATTVLDFAIRVTYETASASQTLIPLAFDEDLLGTSDGQAYLNENVLPNLHWDSTSRTLTATGDMTLYRMIVPGDGTPMKATYNYVGLASTIPEPSTFSLAVVGLILVGARFRGCR